MIEFLLETFAINADKEAIIWQDRSFSYQLLLDYIHTWDRWLKEKLIPLNSTLGILGDFTPNSVSLLLAAIRHECIIVPLTQSIISKKEEFCKIAQVEYIVDLTTESVPVLTQLPYTSDLDLLLKLKYKKHPGLVLFSSGSTGKSKAAVHDFMPLLEKFKTLRSPKRMIAFLLFDHIGGLNTLLYSLSNGGCLVALSQRSPDAVCAAIEKYYVEILPTSPSFINLLLISRSYEKYDLSSLKLMTYGTEVMTETTLTHFHKIFPDVRTLQTYGLSELGILRSKSKSPDSLLMKLEGDNFEARIVDNTLEIKSDSMMLGYLNALNPFTSDGWFKTGDVVEVEGEYVRILGRNSEIINVGGEKVYPAEVESVLQQMIGVEDVAVSGESNIILGKIIKAVVKLNTGESAEEFRKRMRIFCRDRLSKFKMPQKVVLADRNFHGERFKKMRKQD